MWQELGSVGLSAVAQPMLRLGASGENAPSLATTLSSTWALLGLGIYALGTLLWLRVLAGMHLSQAYPFVALAIALTSLLGIWLLGEPCRQSGRGIAADRAWRHRGRLALTCDPRRDHSSRMAPQMKAVLVIR